MRTSTLKSEQVKNFLLESIRNGKYQNGECLPSDNQLTALTGMSRTTVRDAISQLVSAGYMERIQGKGTFVLSTEPERRSSAKSISLFVNEKMTSYEGNPFIEEILFGVHRSLMKKGIGVTLTSFGDNETCLDKVIDGEIPCAWADGVILTSGYSSRKNIDFLLKNNIPCVSIGRPLCSADIPYVDADHFVGGYAAAEHLIELGHRNLAVLDSIGDSGHYFSATDRRRGIEQALDDAGCSESKREFLETKEIDDGNISARVKKFFDGDRKATAIIVYGHLNFREIIKEAALRNIKIPNDLSVVYCMGYQKLYEQFGLITSLVIQPLRDMGSAAVEMLLKKSETGKNRIFRPHFSKGTTTSRR